MLLTGREFESLCNLLLCIKRLGRDETQIQDPNGKQFEPAFGGKGIDKHLLLDSWTILSTNAIALKMGHFVSGVGVRHFFCPVPALIMFLAFWHYGNDKS
jgi:hypothetical protein